MPLNVLTPFFLENKIDSFADFFFPWFGIFRDNQLEGSEKFYQSLPCALKLDFALYNTLVSRSEMFCCFVSSWFHSETWFLLQSSLWFCPFSLFFVFSFSSLSLGHVIHSNANKILLADSCCLYTGMFFLLLLKFFLTIEVNNFANKMYLKYNEYPLRSMLAWISKSIRL